MVGGLILYRCCFYYPNIEIKISDLYNVPSKIMQLNGEYLTYSIDTWEVISEQSADEIGGSYTFETCGDYVFVFDDNSGELLNTIDIT